jgi:hypothetical protein
MFYYLDYKYKNEMKYDGINFIPCHHFTLNFVSFNLGDKGWDAKKLPLHHKLSKQ